MNKERMWVDPFTDTRTPLTEEERHLVNTDPRKSAQPCGCDEAAGHVCQWHQSPLGELIDAMVKREEDAIMTMGQTEGKPVFVTKDSGERRQFESGMQRDTTTGKWLFHLVRFGPMFLRWVGLLTRGAVKYDENNWMRANGEEELKRFLESAERHFAVWMTYRQTGVNIEDPEHPTRNPLTEDHAAAVFFNINGAEYVVERMAS